MKLSISKCDVMKEKRVYAVDLSDIEFEDEFENRDVESISDDEFIKLAEQIGWVWSSEEEFINQWNKPYPYLEFPDREYAEVRIIEVETEL